jgi:hypothetical protein
MTGQQNANMQMFDATVATCNAHDAAWSGNTYFSDAYNDFLTKHALLPAALARQSTTSTGTTEQKENMRIALMQDLMPIADILVLYGKVTKQDQFASDAKTNPTKLRRYTEKALVGYATKLLDVANSITPATIAPYGLTPAMLTNAQAKLVTFTGAMGKPRHQIAEAVRGTNELEELIEDMMEIMTERMDPAAAVLQYTEPAFYAEYKTAREIIDPSFNTRALTVNITTSTGQAIPGATVSINPGNISRQSGATGAFFLNTLTEGPYTMSIAKSGYDNKTVNFSIVGNDPLTLNVQMVSNGATENPPPGGGA